MTPQDPAHHELEQLAHGLNELRSGLCTAAAFGTRARQSQQLLAALPPQFTTVLHSLLNGLEAGAAFDESSCSFDAQQVVAQLADWVAAARKRLQA